jgi:chaperonin GroES
MTIKEPSSTSTNEIPKRKLALEEKYNSEPKKEITKDTNKLPQPTGWRILVLPFKMNEKTKGGLLITESVIERQQVASQTGLVLAMGPQCYADKERYPSGPWCKKGDWVVFARYAGSRIQIEGGEVRLLNEDEVLATVKDPKDILHAY